MAAREGGDQGDLRAQRAPRPGPPRGRASGAGSQPAACRGASLRRDPGARKEDQGARSSGTRGWRRRWSGVPQDRGRRRRRGRGRGPLDGHPREPPDGGRDRKADPHGGAPARARGRPGRGDRVCGNRAAALARGPAGSQPADRQLPVPGTHRRRQDGAGARAGGVHVRLRAGDGAHRHVRVHGETLRVAPGGRAAGICRL